MYTYLHFAFHIYEWNQAYINQNQITYATLTAIHFFLFLKLENNIKLCIRYKNF